MNVGTWVMPLTVAGAFIFMIVYVLPEPGGEPVCRFEHLEGPGARAECAERIRPGDQAILEQTLRFDSQNLSIYRTTDDDFFAQGLHNDTLHREFGYREVVGPDGNGAILRAIPLDARPGDDSFGGVLIGLGYNETRALPKELCWCGDWQETRDVTRKVGELPLRMSVTNNPATNEFPLPETFDSLSRYFDAQGYPGWRDGNEFKCEVGRLWNCTVETLDPTTGTMTLKRNITDGQVWDIPAWVEYFNPRSNDKEPTQVLLRAAGPDRFDVLWNFKVGQTFSLQARPPDNYQDLANHWAPGAYRVDAVGPDHLRISYSPVLQAQNEVVPAYLIGQLMWEEYTLVENLRYERDLAAEP